MIMVNLSSLFSMYQEDTQMRFRCSLYSHISRKEKLRGKKTYPINAPLAPPPFVYSLPRSSVTTSGSQLTAET